MKWEVVWHTLWKSRRGLQSSDYMERLGYMLKRNPNKWIFAAGEAKLLYWEGNNSEQHFQRLMKILSMDVNF